ncbi:MAG: hypothetical protein ABMA15_20250 [Vicinamibacterales bacterium]
MKRVMGTAGALALFAAAAVVSAQVPVDQEPHHTVRLDTILLRVIEVTIAPGDKTLDHRHERDIATIALNDAQTTQREAGQPLSSPDASLRGSVDVTEYTGKPGSHQVENTGTTPYHVIAVENLRSGGWLQTRPMTAAGTSLAQEGRALAVYDVRLGPGTSTTTHPHEMPVVIVLLSGEVELSGSGGSQPSRITQPGQWVFIPGGHSLSVDASGAAHLVEVEIR